MNIGAQVRLGQLETNLVRLRSMSGFLGDRYVMVNIPAAQIEAVENNRVVLRHTAIVGKIDRQTPIVNSKINEIIVNPYWNAPESIVRKDIIPLMRKDPDYLSKNNIHILGPDGNEIDPTAIDWNTEDAAKYRLRQDPGSGNAMASVKINFPSPDGVYMHDTPQQSLFSKLMRFDSLGLRARAERARPRHLAAARHARLDPPAFRGDHQDAARTRRSSSPCRCRSISPTSRPGRPATASCSSATTSTAATASTNCRSRRPPLSATHTRTNKARRTAGFFCEAAGTAWRSSSLRRRSAVSRVRRARRMGMKQTIDVLNRMEADGVIGRYCIAGASLHSTMSKQAPRRTSTSSFHSRMEASPSLGLLTLRPILSYLRGLGYAEFRKEGLVIEGWPVQFLPVANDLDTEALAIGPRGDDRP